MVSEKDHLNRRRGFLGAIGTAASVIAGCLGLRTENPDKSSNTTNYTNDETELSNLRILKGPTPGTVRIAFDVEETGGVEKVATPTIRFYDVQGEAVLPQVPHVELDANEKTEYEMGFLYSLDTELDPEPGDALLISVADTLVKTAEVVENEDG